MFYGADFFPRYLHTGLIKFLKNLFLPGAVYPGMGCEDFSNPA